MEEERGETWGERVEAWLSCVPLVFLASSGKEGKGKKERERERERESEREKSNWETNGAPPILPKGSKRRERERDSPHPA